MFDPFAMSNININQIRCISYNCCSWKSGSHFTSKLLTKFDIYFIQEHWLLKEQLGSLHISNDFFLLPIVVWTVLSY